MLISINWRELKCCYCSITRGHGRRLKEDWGDGPPKVRGGGRPMHSSLNISRSSVIGCVAKYEVTKKGVMKKCFVMK